MLETFRTFRTFRIYGTGSVADPAHLIKCSELDGLGLSKVNYSTYDAVKDYIHSSELREAEINGSNKELDRICKLFGVSNFIELEEIADKRKEL